MQRVKRELQHRPLLGRGVCGSLFKVQCEVSCKQRRRMILLVLLRAHTSCRQLISKKSKNILLVIEALKIKLPYTVYSISHYHTPLGRCFHGRYLHSSWNSVNSVDISH